MKKTALLLISIALIASCNSDDNAGNVITDDTTGPTLVSVDFNFTQNFDGENIVNADFDELKFTNENGQTMSISKLVYLISDISFENSSGEIFTAGDYNLVDVRNASNLTFTPDVTIPEGTYTVSFTYGFNDEDNVNGAYEDLNVADGTWSVPEPLGGGYHYMRLEGKYINSINEEIGYQFHNVRANDMSTTPLTLKDTSIEVILGSITIVDGATIEVKMDVAEWFKNPNLWDLNTEFQMLMPNYDAQLRMNENGQNVFSLGEVTPAI